MDREHSAQPNAPRDVETAQRSGTGETALREGPSQLNKDQQAILATFGLPPAVGDAEMRFWYFINYLDPSNFALTAETVDGIVDLRDRHRTVVLQVDVGEDDLSKNDVVLHFTTDFSLVAAQPPTSANK